MSSQHPLKPPRYWSRESPEGPWDYIVIGSGIGGMTAAALLSKLGRRVLVLEQHYLPGGFTHAFARNGYVWDVGVHVVGEVTDHTRTGRILARLTDGRLRWASVGEVYEEFCFPDGFRIDFPDNPETFRANLVRAFPGEAAAVDRFLAEVKSTVGDLQGWFLTRTLSPGLGAVADSTLARRARGRLARRTHEVLEELTPDPRLQAVLTSQWGYYGIPPSRSSFAIQALITRHFLHGGYYPVGGAQQIGRSLLRTVADAGGWTRVVAGVEEILLEGGRAIGVRLETGEEVRAPKVISACGIGVTVQRLLPDGSGQTAWAEAVTGVAPGPAHLCLYIGFKGDIRQAGVSGANRWFYDTWDHETSLWRIGDGEDLPDAPVLYCSFPSLKDAEHDPGPEQRHTGEVVTFVPWEAFHRWSGTRWQRRGRDYDTLKKRLEEKLLAQFLERLPALAPMVDYVELGTPLSTEFFCRPLAGSIYGLEATPERFSNRWLRARSPIPGLYFAGSDVSTAGVVGAMMGGVLGAVAAEPLQGMRFLGST